MSDELHPPLETRAHGQWSGEEHHGDRQGGESWAVLDPRPDAPGSCLLDVFIPVQPVPQSRPRFTAQGHPYTDTRTRQSEWRLRQYVSDRCFRKTEAPISLAVTVYLSPPKMPKKWIGKKHPSKRPDLSNFIKSVEDALTGVVWRDDAQIVEMHARKQYAWDTPPGWHIEVRELGGEPRP
jgi:Holliday junction resolvase RusA-like endonuclease